MTGQAIAADAIMVGALGVIAGLELRKRRPPRGQALVEFALVLHVLMAILLGAAQMGYLFAYRTDQQNATATLAAVAAQDGPGAPFASAVASESSRIGCPDPDATLTPPSPGPGAIVAVGLRCTWTSPLFTSASWPVSTTASALMPATPTPAPSGSATP